MYLIIGLGKTAQSCQDYCHRHELEFLRLGEWQDIYNLSSSQLSHIKQILLSPGIAPNQELQTIADQHNIIINNDIGVFLQNTNKPCVLITGSNGKSTVVSLLEYLLQSAGVNAKAVGNIGQPVLDYLDDQEIEIYIIEISSFQLETAKCLKSKVSYITNISPDHLDRHGDLETYSKIKLRVYDDCEFKLANINDPWCKDAILVEPNINAIDFTESKLLGDHNKINILACLKIVELLKKDFNINSDKVKSALNDFNGLPHRYELVVENNQVIWVNDSKATNEGSTIAAIDSIEPGKSILILGGQTKGQEFEELIGLINKKVKHVILIGESQDFFASIFGTAYRANSLEKAVLYANNIAKPGDTVLFSPACASFDMFENFEHRGNCFKSIVMDLIKNHKDVHVFGKS